MNETFDPPIRLLSAFQTAYPSDAPEHLIQATGREMWVAAIVPDTDKYTIHAPDLDGRTTFNWRSAKMKKTILKRPLPKWSRYAVGVVYTLCDDGIELPGLDAVVLGDEVIGPRYEYSIGIAIAALIYKVTEREYDADTLIELLERVRRDYVEK